MSLASSHISGDLPVPLMRVCLDARKFQDGGIGVYIRNTVFGLLQQQVSITLLTNNAEKLLATLQRCHGLDISELPQVHIQVVEAKPFSLKELFSLSKEVDWSQFDLFHTPNYLLPFGISCPKVITVHDLIHVFHPERLFYPLAALPILYSSVKRATKVVCVSRSTQDDLLKCFRFSRTLRKKISVVTNSLCPSFLRTKPNREVLRSKFQLTAPYFLSVFSTVKPHKGVSDLLEAFKALERKAAQGRGKIPQLVLVGQGTRNLVEAEKLLQSADALRNVRLLGAVSQADLFQLYNHAEALIVPSFLEGYCLPVIESQAVETPVITRPIPAVLENISPRDIVCEDFSVIGLISGIKKFLELDSLERKKDSEPNDLASTGDESQVQQQINEWQESFRERVDPTTLGATLFQVYESATVGRSYTGIMDEQLRPKLQKATLGEQVIVERYDNSESQLPEITVVESTVEPANPMKSSKP